MILIFLLLSALLLIVATLVFGRRGEKVIEIVLTAIGAIPLIAAIAVYLSIWVYGACAWLSVCPSLHDLGWR